jgi:hypothetical protein
MHCDNNKRTRDIIRAKLTGFVRARQHAYESVIKKGGTIPEYREKISVIIMLSVQLQASANWDLHAHMNWIIAMRPQILTLLPSENHSDSRHRSFRKHMLDLLSYCELMHDTKSFFHTNPKAA